VVVEKKEVDDEINYASGVCCSVDSVHTPDVIDGATPKACSTHASSFPSHVSSISMVYACDIVALTHQLRGLENEKKEEKRVRVICD